MLELSKNTELIEILDQLAVIEKYYADKVEFCIGSDGNWRFKTFSSNTTVAIPNKGIVKV